MVDQRMIGFVHFQHVVSLATLIYSLYQCNPTIQQEFEVVWSSALAVLSVGSAWYMRDPSATRGLVVHAHYVAEYANYMAFTLLEWKRKDLPMVAHHAMTLMSLALSDVTRADRAMVMFLLVMNASTPCLSLAKLYKDRNHPRKAVAFAWFALTFFVCRVCAFPVLVHIHLAPPVMQGVPSVYVHAGRSLMHIVYMMQLYWFAHIVRILRSARVTPA